MKLFKKISCYFDRIAYEIRTIKGLKTLIFMGVFLFLGVLSWIIGGRVDKVLFLYTFPSSAMSIGFAFVLWTLSFILCGCIFSGIAFGCKRYRRNVSYKICLYIVLMFLFVLTVYPLFFGARAPFLAFISLIVAIFFCLMAILSSYKYFSLWTVALILFGLWLLYNAYVCLAFILIN